MDLTTTITTTASTDTENDTVPLPLNCISYTKGAAKHRAHSRPYPVSLVYRECLHNHAAHIGGHALDGCGEFMPSTSSLTCAACGCHRNFHRREEHKVISPESSPSPASCFPVPSHYSAPPHCILRLTPDSPPHHSVPPHQMLLALSTATRQEQINFTTVATPETPKAENGNCRKRKRFRTKFSKEQKEEMFSFAQRLGWKMAKGDDLAVKAFCDKIGVDKGVLKVWMHNNKNTFAKKDANFDINGLNLANSDHFCNGGSGNDTSNQQNGSNNGFSSSA